MQANNFSPRLARKINAFFFLNPQSFSDTSRFLLYDWLKMSRLHQEIGRGPIRAQRQDALANRSAEGGTSRNTGGKNAQQRCASLLTQMQAQKIKKII